MITRIPQPELWGPAPGEAGLQAMEQGQRLAQMFQQGIAEGQRNYIAQKQVAVEKQRVEAQAGYNQQIAASRQSAEAQAKQLALGKDLEDQLMKAGPGSEWRVLLENKSLAMQFYGGLSGGDKDLAKSYYDAHMKLALANASPTSLFKAGGVGFAPQGPQAQPPVAQAGGPAGGPASVLPSGVPAAAAPVPATAVQPPSTVTAPIAAAVIPGNVGVLGAPQAAPPHPARQAQTPVGTTEFSVTTITKGLPQNAATQAATSGLAKIAALAAGRVDPASTVTPKEQAAIAAANKPNIQVMQNAEVTKELLAENGPVAKEVLQRATDFLNAAIQDPTYLKWLQSVGYMDKDESASYASALKNDVALQALLERTVKDQAMRDNAFLNTSLKAQADMDRFQIAYQQILIRARNTKDVEANQLIRMFQLTNGAMHDFVTASDSLRFTFKRSDGSFNEEAFNNAYQKELSRANSPLAQALNLAVTDWAAAVQIKDKSQIPVITQDFVNRYTLGIKLPMFEEPGQATTPYIPSPAAPNAPNAPAPVAPVAPQPGPVGARRSPAAPSAAPTGRRMTPEELIQASGGG